MKKTALVITIAVIVAVCLILVTACGTPRITDVKSLTAANIAAQAKVKSYHMDGNVEMNIALDSEELQGLLGSVELKLPVAIQIAADAGIPTAHITTEAGVSLFGKSVDVQSAEAYLDMENKAVYTKAGESTEWKKSESQSQQLGLKELAGGMIVIGKTVLENAAFQEADQDYSLTMPAMEAGDLIADLHLLDHVDLEIADVQDITVEGGQISYNVDKTTLLVSSIEFRDVDVRGRGVYRDVSVKLKFPLNAVFKFGRYNEIEEAEYAIPKELTADD